MLATWLVVYPPLQSVETYVDLYLLGAEAQSCILHFQWPALLQQCYLTYMYHYGCINWYNTSNGHFTFHAAACMMPTDRLAGTPVALAR